MSQHYKSAMIHYRHLAFNMGMVLLIFYFSFHALTGNRGIFAYFRVLSAIEQQSNVLQELQQERHLLEERLKALHPDTFSVDTLEEIAKRDLGLLGEDEKILYLD
jgi:cell division protein FtsB